MPGGAAHGPTSPFWIGNNATATSTIYSVAPGTNAPAKLGLTVAIPVAGSVTGVAYAAVAGSFNEDAFLFVGEDGTIAGWRGALGTQAEILQSPSDAVYKGAAVATQNGDSYLIRRASAALLRGACEKKGNCPQLSAVSENGENGDS